MVGILNFYMCEIEFYLYTLNLDGFSDSDGMRRLKLRYDFVWLLFIQGCDVCACILQG